MHELYLISLHSTSLVAGKVIYQKPDVVHISALEIRKVVQLSKKQLSH